jgi:hypothetical protein
MLQAVAATIRMINPVSTIDANIPRNNFIKQEH